MSNPYYQHYSPQYGGSLNSFQGIRYQRGAGFFGRLFGGIGSFIKELFPSVAKKALPSAIGFAQDIMEGENIGKSAKSRLLEAGKSAASETLEQLKRRMQRGSGIIRGKRNRNVLFKSKKGKKVNKKRRLK